MTIATVKCPCGGILFDITRPLMMAVGVTHVKCDSCGQAYAFRVEKGEAHDQTDENGAD